MTITSNPCAAFDNADASLASASIVLGRRALPGRTSAVTFQPAFVNAAWVARPKRPFAPRIKTFLVILFSISFNIELICDILL